MSLGEKTFQGTRNVSLIVAPKVGSPISSTAFTDITGLVYLSLFYISSTKEIAMVQLACAAGSSTCATTSNNILKTTNAPHEYTGLSAVSVSNSQDWRIFYHDNSIFLSQVEGNLSGFKTDERVGGTALNGSSIAAVNVNATTNNINVFYVDQLTQALTYQQFTHGAWIMSETVSDEQVNSWNPYSSLRAVYSSGQDQLHVYYTGLDKGIYEFLGSNAQSTNTEWDSQPGRNHIWAEANYVGADIAAVGWSDQVRFFQQSNKVRMVQWSLSNTTWTGAFVI